MTTHQTALITGAARGIGAATAEAFAGAGWTVIAVDRDEPTLSLSGSRHRALRVDVRDPIQIRRLIEVVGDEPQPVTALVNNAAVQVTRSLDETSDEDWENVMEVNVRAAFLLARGLASSLARQAGAIVNVASVHALATSHSMAAYAASKGALVCLTRALAVELAPIGVRVNAVLPGAIDTAMLRAGLERGRGRGRSSGELLRALAERTPMRRIGSPGDVAEAILFLADGTRSSFITGHSLIVDGGALACLSTEVTT